MSLDVFNAYVLGYGDRLLDSKILALQSGYWTGYYLGAKHPKSVVQLSEEMVRNHQNTDAKSVSKHVSNVDVETFLRTEAQFKARLSQGEGLI